MEEANPYRNKVNLYRIQWHSPVPTRPDDPLPHHRPAEDYSDCLFVVADNIFDAVEEVRQWPNAVAVSSITYFGKACLARKRA